MSGYPTPPLADTVAPEVWIRIEFEAECDQLKVLDRDLSPAKRLEVQDPWRAAMRITWSPPVE